MIPLDDFSRYSDIIPEEHHPALRRDLNKVPDFSWLLSSPNVAQERLQGDLLRDVPTVYLDETASPRSENFTVMLLNNSCDLPTGRMDFVSVVPLVDFEKYVEFERRRRTTSHDSQSHQFRSKAEEGLQGYFDSIRRNKVTELIYLPSLEGFPNGAIVLLHLVSSISAKIYQQVLRQGNRLASFTQTGLYFLLMKLTTHIARPEARGSMRTFSDD